MKGKYLFETIEEFVPWYRYENKITMTVDAMLEEPFLSRLKIKMVEENQARYERRQTSNKEWRESNPDKFAEIQSLANEVFVNSEYFHSDVHIESLSRGGVASSVVNLEKNNVGSEDSKMAIYKRALNRKRWAQLLLDLGKDEFLTAETRATITNKTWFNITTRSNFVIKTDKKGGYHNTAHYYKLNKEAVLEAANSNPTFFD